MKNQEKYYNELNKFKEYGLVTEIYKSNEINICNMANYFYVVSNYSVVDEEPYGYAMSKEAIKSIVNDEREFYNIILSTKKEDLEKMIVFYSNNTFDIARNIKKQTDINGPTNDIDLEFEETLKQKNK